MELDRTILRLEKARRKLLATDPGDKEKLLAASRKVDKLVLEYYRVKHGPRATKFATGK
ncbi:aspartyl-phosphate phosphatase Spo0E family protein [Desulfofundulus sp. TPOSR]|uniref:aspartyl-phosphate phosphatase Spo0E family protein n=1 Tax=Desulfofundulus sp. TPOSR TaxID=2714340 RepID=UPI0014084EF6|nr:aspartyl-phosphate phosphatase Spo0E family protein [Desulfofundulus sp. TPOSR]NHM27121.1 aspartyl-phosphate phosphatase Spo0E family protein [Desulfofundulus sp. TPOSR]